MERQRTHTQKLHLKNNVRYLECFPSLRDESDGKNCVVKIVRQDMIAFSWRRDAVNPRAATSTRRHATGG